MKPPLFDYCSAQSVQDALQKLHETPGALILAGGQSLIPAMNFRLVSPSTLIDINRIPEFRKVEVTSDGIVVGATIRHRDLELDAAVHAANPLLRLALAHVAHVPIRNRGTTVGSLCHADAAAEMPMILLLTGGSVMAQSVSGTRTIPAEEFYKFHMTTAKASDELIVSARFPALPRGAGYGFAEFARRRGDYALAAVGAIVSCDDSGIVTDARLAACGIGSKPVRLTAAENALNGRRADKAAMAEAALATADAVTAPDDTQVTQAYRRHLLAGLTRQVLAQAVSARKEAIA
ncbi:FAD binding domain-containing protein [Ferruginivarius sediminum]|uniref:Xanthine dehydrogenase family protein subunit M n=1 Tax=Ferruginivarius sediminum TaxID=2661937 RepID=A0A369TBH4_9PROT|nr:FAD binding domain-containing protein [Ferruginivarius sediminum]RDD62202.1 xanthine dehydrogenase family protein subunit M [Ferruginivarius sediminum]